MFSRWIWGIFNIQIQSDKRAQINVIYVSK